MNRTLLGLVLSLVLAWPVVSHAATLFDAGFAHSLSSPSSPMSFTSSAGNVLTGSIAANTNRVLIAGMMGGFSPAPTNVAMTWNGVSMTLIGSSNVNGFANRVLYLFGLIAPDTGARTLSASWTGSSSDNVYVFGQSFYNADQSTGWSDFTSAVSNSSSPSVTVTTASGDMATASLLKVGAQTITQNVGTSIWISGTQSAASYNAAVGVSTINSWTLSGAIDWGVVGVRVRQSSGGMPGSLLLMGVGQ